MTFELLDLVSEHDAEQVAFAADEETGLRAIVAIHSTVLGPGLGGTRFYPFASERDALVDVLRLAKGMAYKHAVWKRSRRREGRDHRRSADNSNR